MQGKSSRVSVKAGVFSGDRFRLLSLSGDAKSYIFFPQDNCCFQIAQKMRHHWDHFIAAQEVALK